MKIFQWNWKSVWLILHLFFRKLRWFSCIVCLIENGAFCFVEIFNFNIFLVDCIYINTSSVNISEIHLVGGTDYECNSECIHFLLSAISLLASMISCDVKKLIDRHLWRGRYRKSKKNKTWKTSKVVFRSLRQCGITHNFVGLGVKLFGATKLKHFNRTEQIHFFR